MLRLLLSLVAVTLASHHDVPDANRRDQESNRDFSNSLQHGFVQGLLKVSQSGTPDCTTSGLSVARAAYAMGSKAMVTGA